MGLDILSNPILIKENDMYHLNKSRGLAFKWLPVIMCSLATIMLLNDVISAKKLSGAGLAQADFGVFFDFVVYVIPSVSLMCFCLYKHAKEMAIRRVSSSLIIMDWYVIISVLVILLPIIIFIFS